MRFANALLCVALGALAAFVGSQVVKQQRATPIVATAPAETRATQSSSGMDAAQRQPNIAPTFVQASTLPPPSARELGDLHDRIASAPGTYMQAMLVDLNGQLVRWPDLRATGLRVWVQSMSTVHDWDLRYAQMARDAFADWGAGPDGGGVTIRLDFVLDSATSDIQVVWVDHFPPDMRQRVGSTTRSADRNGWLHSAQIAVAIHDSAGVTIPPGNLAGIVRHEAGHALGLGHSDDPSTKMYPVEMVSDIKPADRATLRLLYELPPGRIR